MMFPLCALGSRAMSVARLVYADRRNCMLCYLITSELEVPIWRVAQAEATRAVPEGLGRAGGALGRAGVLETRVYEHPARGRRHPRNFSQRTTVRGE